MRAVLSAESLPAESLFVEPLSAANRLKRQIESQTPTLLSTRIKSVLLTVYS